MTLVAYAPNGKRITHEYWLRPYTAPVEFERHEPEEKISRHDFVAPGVTYSGDYEANLDHDVEYRQEYEYDLAGNKRLRELRWMDEDGGLWASEDLTFKEEADKGVDPIIRLDELLGP